MPRYVLVENGTAAETILWDGTTPLPLPAGVTAVLESSWQGPRKPPRVEETNQQVLLGRAGEAISAMQAHIDRGTFTTAQTSAALLLVLRVCVALVRLTLGRLESS